MKSAHKGFTSDSETMRIDNRANSEKLREYESPSFELFQFTPKENLMQTSGGGQTEEPFTEYE